ncbi:MAG: hypothetical protein AAF433_07550 [Bacteroidota bacterium]
MSNFPTKEGYPDWWQNHQAAAFQQWAKGETGHVYDLLPEFALQLPAKELIPLLEQRLGVAVYNNCLDHQTSIPSPLRGQVDGNWIKRSKMVGVNVRTISTFWQLIRYALTLPQHINAIHLLPIWEPGVVSSLYGMASWQINPEFYSSDLADQYPELNTVEKQLRVVINLLHALGKVVGMDVIPHTDRYSEMVLANPRYFEWLQRDNLRIVDHSSRCYLQAEAAILNWLQYAGSADGSPLPMDPRTFFEQTSEAERLAVLFGLPQEHDSRQIRRVRLVDHLYRLGLEPVPATMAPPYRGLEVDPHPDAVTVDDAGRAWRDYRITAPTEMSRVFGPLTRYQLYERLDENRDWQIDFSRPRPEVCSYVAEGYAAVQAAYNFDFMRGDMSHVQMRPTGPVAAPEPYYDLLGHVKEHIQQQVSHFAYFAESFLVEDDYMGYGNEVQHLIASQAEVTLGNLQSMVPGEEEFLSNFRYYLDLQEQQSVSPCLTIITGDKDDPRFDKFYRWAVEARFFTALLLPDWPAYYSLGIEQRDVHASPWPNEYYTKLYVFQLQHGPKATKGPYRWGSHTELFHRLDWLQRYVAHLWPTIASASSRWLLPPDPESDHAVLAWLIGGQYLCLVNFGAQSARGMIPADQLGAHRWGFQFSTHGYTQDDLLASADADVQLPVLQVGEGVVYGLVLQSRK